MADFFDALTPSKSLLACEGTIGGSPCPRKFQIDLCGDGVLDEDTMIVFGRQQQASHAEKVEAGGDPRGERARRLAREAQDPLYAQDLRQTVAGWMSAVSTAVGPEAYQQLLASVPQSEAEQLQGFFSDGAGPERRSASGVVS